jgi:hypothetical protein
VPERALLLIEPVEKKTPLEGEHACQSSKTDEIPEAQRDQLHLGQYEWKRGRKRGRQRNSSWRSRPEGARVRKRSGFVRAENWHQHQINSLSTPPICL